MKKVMSLIAMFAMGAMLAGCYSKACEEPQPAPAPYKDMAPAAMPAEEAKPMHHKHHHKKHHHKMKHKAMKKAEESTKQEAAPAPAQDNAAEPAAQQ